MKTKNLISGMTLKVLTIIMIGLLTSQYLLAQGWSYRMPVTVTNSSGGDLSQFQVNIVLKSTDLDFSKAKDDGSDLRVADSDGTTLLPFWIESWVYGDSVSIWTKVPFIPNITGTTLYVYYGNDAATSASSGASTFDFFDDFESGINPEPEPVPYSGWQDLDDIPVPTSDATAAVFDEKLYVFGGYGIDHVDLDIVYEYDPATGNWTSKEPMPSERWGMIAVEFEGLIYVFGGRAGAYDLNVLEIYNPSADTWSTGENLPVALSYQGLMGVKFGDKIHLFYGSYHYEYDPATDTYLRKNNVPSGRTWGTCAVVGSSIYLIGGYSGGGTSTNQVLDPVNDSWTTAAPLPVDVYGATRENPVIDGKIYVTHGWDNVYFYVTNYMYDPVTDTWTQRGSAQHARDGVACGSIGGKLYVVGGRNVISNTFGLPYHEVYNPSLDPWNVDPNPVKWTISRETYVYPDESAKYSGDYGLLISSDNTSGSQYAESVEAFGSNYVLDFEWNVISVGGVLGTRPETHVRLSEDPNYLGNFYHYNDGGTQVLRWYNGSSFTQITNSTRDAWHKVSMSRNGAYQSVVFDGESFGPYTGSGYGGGTGKFRFSLVAVSNQYIDNVRVRKWASSYPSTEAGTEESLAAQWNGSISNDWNTAGNWNTGIVPAEFNYVMIPDVTPYPEITGSVTVRDVYIEPSARMTIGSGGALTANTITINSSDTQHSGSLVNLGTVNSTVIYNRYLLPKISGGDWQLAASPVVGNTEANTDDILSAKEWKEVEGVWNNGGMLGLLSCKGYNLKQTETGDGIVTFSGTLLNEDQVVPATSPFQNSYDGSYDGYLRGYADGTGNSGIARDADEHWGGGGWNLLGNPFASALSITKFIDANYGGTWETSQFDPSYVALYIHDGASFTGGSPTYKYVSKTIDGWAGDLTANSVQVGQGFFVLAMKDESSFTFTRDMQEHDVGAPMLKSARTDDRWPGLKLSVKAGSEERSTLIVYNDDMTPGLDPSYDVGQYGNYSSLEIYTTLAGQDNGVNFARQALPKIDYDINKVPVGIDFESGGTVTFSASTVPIGSYKFWLEDRTTGTFTDLSTKSYTVTLPQNSFGTGRFYILASANTPTVIDDPEAEDTGLRIWISNNKAVIKGSVSDRALCEIYSVQGNKILEHRLADGELNTVDLPSGLKGVFLVRVTDGIKVTSRKVALL